MAKYKKTTKIPILSLSGIERFTFNKKAVDVFGMTIDTTFDVYLVRTNGTMFLRFTDQEPDYTVKRNNGSFCYNDRPTGEVMRRLYGFRCLKFLIDTVPDERNRYKIQLHENHNL
jgi:hypothetical protein